MSKHIHIIEPVRTFPFAPEVFFSHAVREYAADIFEDSQEPFLMGSKTGIPSRVLNYLKVNLYGNENRSKKYSFIDFIWLRIIEQLKGYLVELEFIKKLQTSLFSPVHLKRELISKEKAAEYIENLKIPKKEQSRLIGYLTAPAKGEGTDFPMLFLLIAEILVTRKSLALAIFTDGTFVPINYNSYLISDEENARLETEVYIHLSLSGIVTSFLRSELAGKVVPEIKLLRKDENKLFALLQKEDFDSIEIHLTANKSMITLKPGSDVRGRVADVLFENEYKEILVHKNDRIQLKVQGSTMLYL